MGPSFSGEDPESYGNTLKILPCLYRGPLLVFKLFTVTSNLPLYFDPSLKTCTHDRLREVCTKGLSGLQCLVM